MKTSFGPVTLLFFCLAPLQGAGIPSAELLQKGALAYQHKDYIDALGHFVRLLEQFPQSPQEEEARRYVGLIVKNIQQTEQKSKMTDQEYAAAVDEAKKRWKEDQEKNKRMLLSLELAYKAVEGSRDPVETLRVRPNLAPVDIPVQNELESLQAARYLEGIRKALEKDIAGGISSKKNLLEARGFLFFYQGQLENAASEWEKALRLNPTDETLKKNLGEVQTRLAEEKRKDEINFALTMGKQYLDTGANEQALKQFQKLLALDPGHANGKALLELAKQGVEKQKRLNEIAQKRTRAIGLWQQGAQEQSILVWVEVLELDPTNEEAKRYLSKFRNKPHPEASPNAAQKEPEARGKTTAGDRKKALEEYALGLVLYTQGEIKKAKEAFQRAYSLDPSFEKARRSLDQIAQESSN